MRDVNAVAAFFRAFFQRVLRRLSGEREDAAVRELPERIDPAQCTPWPEGGVLVGGAVRDLLLGREPTDFDWVVPDPAAAAERVAAALGGRAFALDAARGQWRAVARPGAPLPAREDGAENEAAGAPWGEVDGGPSDETGSEIGSEIEERDDAPLIVHDFGPLPDDLADDLARRDFTVGAIAARADGSLVDPFGGRADLAAGRLRMVARANLDADPLRALRAARLATTLELELEPATRIAVHEVARAILGERLPRPAWERVGVELDRIVASERADAGVRLLVALDLVAAFVPELEEGRGLEQGGFHHQDVLQHQIEALGRLVRGFPDADLALRWATLLHDVAKPATREVDEGGRVRFYGHAKQGAEMAAHLLRRLRAPDARARRVAALVGDHMVQLPATERSARRFAHRRRELLPDLLALMLADREAARGPRSSEASRVAYRAAISRVLAALRATPERPPLLDGNEIMALLGLEPGPEVGRALAFVREAEAVGDVATRDEAVAALRRYAAAQGWIEGGADASGDSGHDVRDEDEEDDEDDPERGEDRA